MEQERLLLTYEDLNREMETARRIQRSLLPQAPPHLLGVRISCRSVPAHFVGGDYYDFFRRDENTIDVVIADVSGHDLGAALIMVATRGMLRANAYRSGTARDALAVLNELLFDDLTSTELILSMFYAKYSIDNRLLSYANGGHEPPLLYRCGKEGCMFLDSDGMVLGVMQGASFEEKTIGLREGDLVLFYTDGITEVNGPTGELFGRDRLCRSVYRHRGAPPEGIIDGILSDLAEFAGGASFADDISLVVMKVD